MTAPTTLPELFFQTVERYRGHPAALMAKQGAVWLPITHDEVYRRVRNLSLALESLGVVPGDRLAILSGNRPEWMIADHACLTARCAAVAIYPTLPAAQAAYILKDAGASVVFVEDMTQLAKVREVQAQLPALRHIIGFEPSLAGAGIRTVDELIAQGDTARGREGSWRERALSVRPDDLATLIYTSGTTGDPKGVMLTHGNFTSNALAGLSVLQVTPEDSYLSFLPLSHVFERMLHFTIFHAGALISYARSIDTVAEDMMSQRPTVFASVPRLYEKIHAKSVERASASALTKRIFDWSVACGRAWADRVLAGTPVPPLLALQYRIADRLVFSKLRGRTGGRIRFFISGGAPLSPDLARFFYSAGLTILEGYGLTETSPVIAVNGLSTVRMGTVGRPMPGNEVRIAPDGEIITRGPNIMKGYWNKPEATAEVLDAEGWFRTGDIGELDADGFLRITDRKKDIIVTAGGKNIAPQPIENRVKGSPFVVNAVMIGDTRRFPVLLVVPNLERLKAWARHKLLPYAADEAALLRSDAVHDKMQREVVKVTADLAPYERPKKLLLIAEDFSVERGELTPTLKVKRRVVEDRFRREIDLLYMTHETGEI